MPVVITYRYEGGPRVGKTRTVSHNSSSWTALRYAKRDHLGPQGCVTEWKAAGMNPGIYRFSRYEGDVAVFYWYEIPKP